MPTLPPGMLSLLAPCAPHCSRRIWPHARVLVGGTLLVPGRRTVTTTVRAMGRDQHRRFERYHRVRTRARWSRLAVRRPLLRLLVATFVPDGPLLIGIDATIARRGGATITATGIYGAPVRSRHSHVGNARGLRWVCRRLCVPIPWAAVSTGAASSLAPHMARPTP